MTSIINIQEAIKIAPNFRKKGQSIILAGGCFDVVHVGHVKFFEEAKRLGDVLFVLLESDEKVLKLKGNNRPLFNIDERAKVISSLKTVDYVVTLPDGMSDNDYDLLIERIKPSVIAITQGDLLEGKKRRQTASVGAQIAVIPHVKTHSSSKLAKLLGIN